MSRKMKGFFQHPFVVMTRLKSSKLNTTNSQEPSLDQQRQYLFKLKLEDINFKKSQLDQINGTICKLKEVIEQSHANRDTQKERLQVVLQDLRAEEKQKESELEHCQEIESIDPNEFKVWKEESARVSHALKMKALRQEYANIKRQKTGQLQTLEDELEEIRSEQKELSLKLDMLKGEEPQSVRKDSLPQSSEEEVPDNEKIITEIRNLKQRIADLEQTNIGLIHMVKEELDSSTWGVKQKFEQSKDRIQKQMKRLARYFQRPNKQVIRKVQNPDKIAQPITLIQDYQNRLRKIQQTLPSELREDRILRCLRPLPWKSIKGVALESNDHNNSIHDKFQRLKKQFTQVELQNQKCRDTLAQKESQAQTLKRKIQEFEQKIQATNQEL